MNWESPDGGEWYFEGAHFPTPVSRLFGDIIDRICEGWVTGAAEWGLTRGDSRWVRVNGYLFYGARGEGSSGNAELAARAVRERWWNAEADRWFNEERPGAVAVNREYQAVDVRALDDRALRSHTRAALRHLLAVAPLHFAHRGREVVLGELRKAADAERVAWSEIEPRFAGGSPASSRPGMLVAEIAAALRSGGVDVASLSTLDEVRAVPAASALLDAYLDEFGHRLVDSYDLAEPTLGERPHLIVASIRAAARPRPPASKRPEVEMSDELRRLLEEARTSYGIEDDDDGVCIFWPSGILRMALLELGRRAGLPDDAAIFELSIDELESVLDGEAVPADELVARAAATAAARTLSPPASLGTGAAPERAAAAGSELKGTGVGSQVVRGRACVVRGSDDALLELQPDDVLIAFTTNPGYNTVLPIVSAVATEAHMGHTVICARELDIPAVVGVAGLLDAVPNGAMVEVDAAQGIVRVLAE